jgi:hypothetical protein
MRKARCIGLFLAVVFLGDRLLSFSAARIVECSKNAFVRMYERKNSADVVFLGNSRVDRNIDYEEFARLTGRRGLNLGLGGNHLLIAEALLKDFVQRYGNPEFVVVELSCSIVEPCSMGEMQIFSYYSTNMEALARSIDPTYTAFEKLFKCLRFNNPAFWRLAAECIREPSDRRLRHTIPPEKISQWRNGRRVEHPVYEKNVEALKRICEFADSRNITVVLMIAPYWQNYRDAIVNFESWKGQLQAGARKHPIHDYSDLFREQSEFFNDEMHLNSTGAKNFVVRLISDKVLY